MNDAQPVLTTQDLAIGYARGRQPAFIVSEGINVALHAGELACLIGPNGAGKSTLMRTLAGMQPALRGDIWLAGDAVADLSPRELARRMSVVLTERLQTGPLSAYALAALGRHPYTDWTGRLTERDEAVVRWALEAVGAAPLAARLVDELSDGERQKVLIARALAQEPIVMLLDEPTAFLDLPNRVEAMRVLRQLTRETGRAVLLSTHDLDLALRSADTIWLLPRDAPLRTGAPEDLVLDGSFEAAFRSEGVRFDRQTGAFAVVTPTVGEVALAGEGLAAAWTRHALERVGFRVRPAQTPCPSEVTVIAPAGAAPRWRVRTNGTTLEVESVAALLRQLRAP